MEPRPGWTLEELCRCAALALRSAPGARPPDARAVRWYAGIGLVDRPVGGRGRGARYGLRHLRQVVAVRRLQAEGWSLAEIQGRIAGADDDDLQALARLPSLDVLERECAPPDVQTPLPPRAPARAGHRFWAVDAEVRLDAAAMVHPAASAVAGSPAEVSAREAGLPREVGAVQLADGVVLLLPRPPSASALPRLAEAAAPLLAALARLGLAGAAVAPAAPAHEPPSPSTVPGGPS